MAPFFIDVTGNTLNLYDTIEPWDNINHFVNWMLLLWGCGLLIARADVRPRWLLVFGITGLGAILAVGWEPASGTRSSAAAPSSTAPTKTR
ncbi:hypothetical protein [Aeromicrobium sp. UC242_57]|uniref:hypothetical protein n=1 Tax=Aeromicrobium sp. UC242_57 TaxID=3374624 RepID=UPI00379D3B9B